MSSELTLLVYAGLLTILQLFAAVIAAQMQVGLPYLLSPRDTAINLTGIAGRLQRASNNMFTALTLFAPAILLLHAQGGFTATTLLAAQVFLVMRVLYALLYPLGTPVLRTLSWTVALLANAVLYFYAI